MKNILISVWNIYGYVSVFLHEISHIIVLVFNRIPFEVSFTRRKNCNFTCTLHFYRNISTRTYFYAAYAPLFLVILIFILAFFSKFFLILFIYTLTNLKKGRSLPSKTDIETYKSYVDKIYNI